MWQATKKVGFKKQYNQKDCGIICLINILKYYNIKLDYAYVRNNIQVNAYGTSLLDMKNFLKQRKIESSGYKVENYNDIIDSELPVIAQVMRGKVLHFVVLYKIKNNKFYLSDPEIGKMVVKKERFFGEWTGFIFAITNTEKKICDEVKSSKINVRELLKTLLLENIIAVCFIVFLGIVISILNIITSFYYQIMNLMLNGVLKNLVVVSILTLLLYSFISYFQYFSQKLSAEFSQKMEKELKRQYIEKVVEQDYETIISYELGDITVRQQDITIVSQGISLIFSGIFLNIILLISFLFFLFSLNMTVSFILFIGSIIYFLLFVFSIIPLNKKYKIFIKKKEDFDNSLLTIINGILPIRLLNGQYLFKQELFKKNDEQCEHKIDIMNYSSGINNFSKGIMEFIRISVIGYLFYLGIQGTFNFLIMMSINFLLNHYLSALNGIVTSWAQLSELHASIESLNHFFSVQIQDNKTQVLDNKIEQIEFKDCTIFHKKNKYVIERVSFKIDYPQKILITGRSGSGKTTLVNALVGLHKRYYGAILLNQFNIKDLNDKFLKEKIGVVPANDYFFQGTIIENLTMKKEVPISKIITYCEQLGVLEEILEMENRFETVLLEDGRNLSTGQKKRLSIIRMLLNEPDVMVFDEPTANLDIETKHLIMEYILSLEKIAIIISHEDFYVDKINHVYHIQEGKMSEVRRIQHV